MGDPSNRGAQGAGLGGWFAGGLDAVEQERQAAEAKGREVYEQAIQTGQNVQARTRAELIALGRSRLAQESAEAGPTASMPPSGDSAAHKGLMQADAFLRAASNKLTFGFADNIEAAGDALASGGEMAQFGRRYQANLQQQHARDAYDAQFRRTAHNLGDRAGEVLSLVAGARAGIEAASALSPAAKGALGEGLSVIKTLGRGQLPKAFQVEEPVAGGFTRVDHVTTGDQFVEAKFGPRARLTPRQREAQLKLGPAYRVDRWGPGHVGMGTGAVTGAASVSTDDDGR